MLVYTFENVNKVMQFVPPAELHKKKAIPITGHGGL
jgi:hypothetical protein